MSVSFTQARINARRGPLIGSAAIAAFAIIAGAGSVSGQQPGIAQTGIIYTGNEEGHSISAIDLQTGQVTTIDVPLEPHNVQVTADGTLLLAVGEAADGPSGMGEMPGMAEGRLLLFSTTDLAGGPIAAIDVGEHPAHVVADPTGTLAFVTLSAENAVAVVDLAGEQVVAKIATGVYPHGLRLSPDGRLAYVANVEGDSISVIDVSLLTQAAEIPVGDAPVQVGFTPDGTRAFVSLRDENAVAVIDTATQQVVSRIAVGNAPIQVHATPDGRFVYVANQGTETAPGNTVSVIEVATGQVTNVIQTGAGPHGVAVSDDGRFAFVTNIFGGDVSVIAVAEQAVVATFAVGEGPNGITYRP